MCHRLFIISLLIVSNFNRVDSSPKDKTILILHSYNTGLTWTDNLNKAITTTIYADSSIQPDFRIEFLDTKRFETPGYFKAFAHFFLTKYKNTSFDLLISTDNAAFNFLANYRDSLLNKPPVVFCGLNYVDSIPQNMTGVMEDIDIYSNISSILKLTPEYSKFYFIVDRSITGNVIYKKTSEIVAKSFPDLRYEFLTDFTVYELKQKLSLLSSNDVVLLTAFNTDRQGNQISYDKILDYLSPVCKAPIYGTWDFYLDKGIVGGKIVRASTHGEYAGKIALRLLHGTLPSYVEVEPAPSEFVFDYKEMKRAGIAKQNLPKGSTIINSPLSVLRENPQLMLFVSIVFLLMLIVIVVLTKLFNNEKQIRKKEQSFLRELRMKSIELEGALQLAEKSNQLKSAFLSNLSHEIRTPMNAIVGFSDLLVSNYPDKKLEEYVSIIRVSSSQLLGIINDIIEISMIDTNQVNLHIGAVNIKQTINEVCASFALAMEQNPKVELRLKFPDTPDDFITETDEVKLRQVITNLISNALKFTGQGFIEVGFFAENGFLEFYVKDTGIGIEPKYHEEIFERFWRVDHSDLSLFRGLGIGLTLSRSFVQLMGGNIWLHSEPGKGSTFYFTVPFKKASSTKELPAENEQIFLGNNTILICEDDENNLFYFKELFSKTNTFVLWAKNGNEAVKAVRENPGIDLVLMDLKMPEMNGWEATKIIKGIRPDLPVIAQTAHALTIETSQLSNVGFDDYVTKPIKKNELFDKIARYIG